MKQPKILHIAPWASGRVFKQVLMQQSFGWDVTLVYGITGARDLLSMVNKYVAWTSAAYLKTLTGFDTIVVHSTIGTYPSIAKLELPEAGRLVWDCHDYISAEIENKFDAIVCPSEGMTKQFNKPTEVIYSKVPLFLAPRKPTRQRLDAVALVASIGNGNAWSDYSGIDERLGKHVFIYPGSDKYEGHENENVLKNIPFTKLLPALTRYRYGYAGSANDSVTINDCVTNKFWEYLAAGCEVILNGRAQEMAELLGSDETKGENIYLEMELPKIIKAYGL